MRSRQERKTVTEVKTLLVLPMAALDLTVVMGSVDPRFHINPSIYTVMNEKRHFLCSAYLYFQYSTSINCSPDLMRRTDILPGILPSVMGGGGQAIDYTGWEYGAMHWYRRPSSLPCRLAEVARDTARSYLSLQTVA